MKAPQRFLKLVAAAGLEPIIRTVREEDGLHSCLSSAHQRAVSTVHPRVPRAIPAHRFSNVVEVDLFRLVFRAQVIVVDFSGKNANVMYETGIAHTLGKHVIPITQSRADVPSDMMHHRALVYLPNNEGFISLEAGLSKKLEQFRISQIEVANPPSVENDDDIPF